MSAAFFPTAFARSVGPGGRLGWGGDHGTVLFGNSGNSCYCEFPEGAIGVVGVSEAKGSRASFRSVSRAGSRVDPLNAVSLGMSAIRKLLITLFGGLNRGRRQREWRAIEVVLF